VIAAGATITADVPPDTLAIARAPQVNRPGWAARQRALLAADGGHEARGTRLETKSRGSRPAARASGSRRMKKGKK
jgi:bifunctional UDP-N-acetylglucosamine pyrophosphorylase/glucosamine-1-phosphate N-acetyltransferase